MIQLVYIQFILLEQVCGVDVGLEAYKFIYFTNPSTDKYLTKTLCVKECPSAKPEMDSDGIETINFRIPLTGVFSKFINKFM